MGAYLKRIVVFGIGEKCRELLKYNKEKIDYFVDNDERKQGGVFENIKIFHPRILEEEKKSEIIVFISSNEYYYEISKQLLKMGFKENENFFSWGIYHFQKEMKKREKKDFFSYKYIACDMTPNPKEYGYNSFYGNDRVLRAYLGLPQNEKLDAVIEHGVYVTDVLTKVEIDHPFPVIYTFSNYRKDLINKIEKNKEVVAIGPYIQYARGYYDDEKLKIIKKEYGKILLVFPAHSSRTSISDFSMEELLKKIKEIKYRGRYDNVFICLYWKDILEGRTEIFSDEGYIIVSAGHIYDYLFLDRLKNIIDLADMTMSNDFGAHIGYCIARGKPHYCVPQSVRYDVDKVTNYLKRNFIKEKEITDSIKKEFSAYSEMISDKQMYIIRKYWGMRE